MNIRVSQGEPFPIGSSVKENGTNFSLFAEFASSVELVLFENEDDAHPSVVIEMNKKENCSFSYWHVFVEGVKSGQLYGYHVDGRSSRREGLQFNKHKTLLDPYTKAVSFNAYGDRALSVVVDDAQFDWENDRPLQIPEQETIIYEMHVSGFTKNPNSSIDPSKRGTYLGLIEKIPYLKSLGVTCVELMPVQQFDDGEQSGGKKNYWGYNPMAFFAVHFGYSNSRDPIVVRNEFKSMIKAFHAAGIEVVLDVVFNHTSEGNHKGPTQSFKGIANNVYYMLEKNNHQYYKNYSGCGNTLNANNSVVRRMILDCLRSWVLDMHVDGFRFDLASTFSRDSQGHLLSEPPILWDIETDPVLSNTKIIAEPWDAGGLYQVGHFPGHRWMEWNGRFRDDMRKFLKGEPGMVPSVAARLVGSADLFSRCSNASSRSINFVTCHDGFTLYDLVSYNHKHNLKNGEHNRDGSNDNDSWNCGVEGETDCAYVQALRLKQSKNLIALLLLSQGTPMLLMGDEAGRTQNGNNNAYCHDSQLSWFDWERAEEHQELLLFVKKLIGIRKKLSIFHTRNIWATHPNPDGVHLTWHGVEPNMPDWTASSRTLAFEVAAAMTGERIYVATNAYWESVNFKLPEGCWSVDVSTDKSFEAAYVTNRIQLPPRSLIVLSPLKNRS